MLYKNRSQSLNHRQRKFLNYAGLIPKQHDRLVFPVKEQSEGYVGKKQFFDKHSDNVKLGENNFQVLHKRDQLDVSDIQGATPHLNIELIKNKSRVFGSQKNGSAASLHPHQDSRRRLATDSLDELLQQKSSLNRPISKRRQKTEGVQSHENMHLNLGRSETREIQKYLLDRNRQLTKEHILGLYSQNSKLHNPEIQHQINSKQVLPRNPTYLSSFKLF